MIFASLVYYARIIIYYPVGFHKITNSRPQPGTSYLVDRLIRKRSFGIFQRKCVKRYLESIRDRLKFAKYFIAIISVQARIKKKKIL